MDTARRDAGEACGGDWEDAAAVAEVWAAVRRKLETEPIEDLRVDLEDGFGDRGDDEEDAAARLGRASRRRRRGEG